MKPLKSVQWLAQHLHDHNVIIIDASVDKVVGREPNVYEQFQCVEGAFRFDPVALPDTATFNAEAERLGILHDSIIVVYDNQGIYSAPRAWWLFKYMGLTEVYVLDGGLPAWLQANLPVVSEYARAAEPGTFKAKPQSDLLSDTGTVLKSIANDDVVVVDARSETRFRGESAEPRPGLRPGHIPGSVNVHFASLLDGEQLKSDKQLTEVLNAKLPDKRQQIIASCGSGMTACILLLAATELGYPKLSLYDGSWSEWGRDERLPVETA